MTDPMDKSVQQINTVSYVFSKEQHGTSVECVVVPEYGTQVSAKKLVDLGYGSTEETKFSSTIVGIIVGVVAFLLVIIAILVVYIVRIKWRKHGGNYERHE